MNTNNKRLSRLIIVLVILCSILFLFHNTLLFTKEKKVFSRGDMKNVVRIVVFNDEQKQDIYLANNHWYIQNGALQKEKFQTKKIDDFFNTILGLNKNEIVSTNKKKYEQFGITRRQMIELELKNGLLYIPGKKLKKIQLFIGTHDFSHTYFKISGDVFVYSANRDLSNLLNMR